MRALTELDKTILLSFLILGKDTNKFISDSKIISKFPVRQRKAVRKHIKKLEHDKLLGKHRTKESHQLTEEGLKRAKRLLAEGVTLWAYR